MKSAFLQKIKLIVTDCDGVLTDGGLYYGADGITLKKFNTKDGMAFTMLKGREDIQIIIMTGENTELTRSRAAKFDLEIHQGIENKLELLQEIVQAKNIKMQEVAYIGDDLNDLECMKKVGLAACPSDAVAAIKAVSHYKCQKGGGQGCVRELVDLILAHH